MRKAQAEKDARLRRELEIKARKDKELAIQAAVKEALAQAQADQQADIERM